jgi:hypothetical protein
MDKNAAFRDFVNSPSRLVSLTSLAAVAILVMCLGDLAAAKGPLGKDGQIHACYRVKGKPKGALRVVPSARTHCRRGERKTAWSVAGSAGLSGGGSAASQGPPGQTGSNGSNADEAALKTQIGDLSLRVQTLEGVLDGITNGDLTGMVSTLQGLNNEQLTGAVDALPAVESLCGQSEDLTEQVNLVAGTVEDLGLNGTLTGLGGLIVIPPLPAPLAPFTCPTL